MSSAKHTGETNTAQSKRGEVCNIQASLSLIVCVHWFTHSKLSRLCKLNVSSIYRKAPVFPNACMWNFHSKKNNDVMWIISCLLNNWLYINAVTPQHTDTQEQTELVVLAHISQNNVWWAKCIRAKYQGNRKYDPWHYSITVNGKNRARHTYQFRCINSHLHCCYYSWRVRGRKQLFLPDLNPRVTGM